MPALPLAHSVLGDGPPVLVLHGLLGQGRNWAGIARQLARQYRIFLVDLRNHGSSPHDAEMTYAAMAADVARLIDEAGLERPSLIGHSMGGKVAMTLALEAEVPLQRLAVIDIAPVPYPSSAFGRYLDAMLAIDVAALRRRAEVDAALAAAVPDAAVRAFLTMNIGQRGDQLAWTADLTSLRRALPEITGFPRALLQRRSELPALFLRGGRSPYVPDEHLPQIRGLFAEASIRTVEGAGHWVHAEAPDATVTALLEFLSTP